MNHFTAKAATLSHSLKKNLGVYAPSCNTTDAEFDESYAQFKKTIAQVENVQSSLKANKQAWDNMRRQFGSTLTSNHGLIPSRESATPCKRMLTGVMDQSEKFETTVRPVVTGSDPGMSDSARKFTNAERLLADYLKFTGEVKAKVSKRESVRKELDYYRGKADSMSGVNASKKVDQDKAARTSSTCEQLQTQYSSLHESTSALVRQAVLLGDQTAACALAAYLDFQAEAAEAMASSCRHSDEMKAILSAPWPTAADFSSEDPLSSPLSSLSMESESADANPPAPSPQRPKLPGAVSSSSSDGSELTRKPSRPAPPMSTQTSTETPGSPKPVRPAPPAVPSVASLPSLPSNGGTNGQGKAVPAKPPRPSRLSEPEVTTGGC